MVHRPTLRFADNTRFAIREIPTAKASNVFMSVTCIYGREILPYGIGWRKTVKRIYTYIYITIKQER